MNFLNKIFRNPEIEFKNNEIVTLLNLIDQLREEIKEKDKLIYSLMEKSLNTTKDKSKSKEENIKLTRKETLIYNIFKDNPQITRKKLAKLSKIKYTSLLVMISRIRKKNFSMNFQEDEY